MRFLLLLTFGVGLLAGLPAARAQTVIDYWHAQDATQEVLEQLADAFNASQSEYRVVPRYAGNYQEAAIKLIAALGSGGEPVLFDAEGTVFARLAEEGALADLGPLTEALPEALLSDLEPVLWESGLWEGERYGLPWTLSMPVLFYNATAFAQLGLEPPTTWEAFEAVAQRLSTRNTRGYIDVALPLIFEAIVSTRGGRLVDESGRPTFDSPEAIEALEMLQRMARARSSIPRGGGELDQALVDFARAKGMMAIASEAFFPQGERFSVTFEVGAAPLPQGENPKVPIVGAQLVVLKSASEAERKGALAFWQFLMEPDNQATWVTASYFLPVRRSARVALSSWYQADPSRGAALAQLPLAVHRPKSGQYAVWQSYLQEAIERVTKGGADPAAALAEAQRRALEDLR